MYGPPGSVEYPNSTVVAAPFAVTSAVSVAPVTPKVPEVTPLSVISGVPALAVTVIVQSSLPAELLACITNTYVPATFGVNVKAPVPVSSV